MATLDSFVERLIAERLVTTNGTVVAGNDASLWRVNTSTEDAQNSSGVRSDFSGGHLLVMDGATQDLVTVCVQLDKAVAEAQTGEATQIQEEDSSNNQYVIQPTARANKTGPRNCDICGAVFNTQEGLERHMCTHTGIFPFTCDVCSRGFVRKYRLQKHMVVHSGERKFQCETCGKQFAQKNVLDRHMLVHGEKLQFKCPMCDAVYNREDNLKRHVLKHHQDSTDGKHIERYLDEMRFPQGGRTLYRCSVCNKEVLRRSDLRRHLAVHPEEVAAATKIIAQGLLGEVRKSAPARKPEAAEDDTDKTTAISVLMEEFAKPEKQGNVTYCEVCSAGFCTQEGLQRHMCTHTGSFPFQCEFCGRGFVKKYRLQKHLVVHTGERPFQCEYCMKVFAQKNVLARHRLTHAEKSLFHCRLCGATFNRKDNMKKHMITKHIKNKSERRPVEHYLDSQRLIEKGHPYYKCKVCTKEFRKRCNLRKHLTMHSTKMAAQIACANESSENAGRVDDSISTQETCDICQMPFAKPGPYVVHFRCLRKDKSSPSKIKRKSTKNESKGASIVEKSSKETSASISLTTSVQEQTREDEGTTNDVTAAEPSDFAQNIDILENSEIMTLESFVQQAEHDASHTAESAASSVLTGGVDSMVGHMRMEDMIQIIVSNASQFGATFGKPENNVPLHHQEQDVCFVMADMPSYSGYAESNVAIQNEQLEQSATPVQGQSDSQTLSSSSNVTEWTDISSRHEIARLTAVGSNVPATDNEPSQSESIEFQPVTHELEVSHEGPFQVEEGIDATNVVGDSLTSENVIILAVAAPESELS